MKSIDHVISIPRYEIQNKIEYIFLKNPTKAEIIETAKQNPEKFVVSYITIPVLQVKEIYNDLPLNALQPFHFNIQNKDEEIIKALKGYLENENT